MPTTPQRLAGTRTEPPESVPGARSTRPVATATAEPVEEPPAVRVGSSGFGQGGRPVAQPIIPHASSCIASLPTETPPAARVRATTAASRAAGVAP